MLDGFRRVEEHSPVWMLPRLIATQNMQKLLSAARQRVCDGHKAQMKLMGADVENCGDGGGISVQGDTATTIHNTGLKPLGMVAAIIAALLVGAGIALLCWYLFACPHTPSTGAASADNWRLGIRVSDTP